MREKVDNRELGSVRHSSNMCARRQNKSFLIEDILKDVNYKSKNKCDPKAESITNINRNFAEVRNVNGVKTQDADVSIDKILDYNNRDAFQIQDAAKYLRSRTEIKDDSNTSQAELRLTREKNPIEADPKFNFDHRRNTYPLCPMPVKASVPWSYRVKESTSYPIDHARHSYNLFNDATLHNNEQLLRHQLAANRYLTNPFAMRLPGYDRAGWCHPWWGALGAARRKGGQVRFSSAQTGALERRFSASKYLSPDDRRALAASLRLSDRQVKTWFQNRRAKWRRSTPEGADEASPAVSESSDPEDIDVADSSRDSSLP